MKFVVVLILVAYAFVLNDADPTECYHCTLINLNTCVHLNPLNKGRQSCSNINTFGHKNTTSKTVCYHVTATWLGLQIAERGCFYAEMENEDLCTYFKRTEASGPFTSNYTCKLCDTTNCNSDN